MTQQVIKAEVRLYFNGRLDWDTEFFDATSNTDILTKAKEIAKRKRANHFSCGRATAEDEYKHEGPRRAKKVLTEAEQIAAIQKNQEERQRGRAER